MAVQFSPLTSTYAANHVGIRPIISRTIPNRTGASKTGASLITPASTAATLTPPASSAAPTTTPSTAPSTGSSPSGFNSLIPATATTVPTAAPPSDPSPTPQSVFGANPWITNPTGTGPIGSYNYNPYYFATPQTAATVAGMVGGKVVPMNAFTTPGSMYVQNQPNQMVQLPNGALINPGLVAAFYTHGYPQSMINQMIANEVANVSEGK